MGIFSSIAGVVTGGAAAVGSAATSVHDLLRALANSEARRDTAFAIAMVALYAKMAKADGVVSRSEVDAFCRIFTIPPGEERNVSRLYNLAKADVAGFETYADDIRRLFGEDRELLEDILDGLYAIAKADGAVHERELGFIERIGAIFGFDEHALAHIRARHVIEGERDPYLVLDAEPGWDDERLRRHYRRLVKETHPDRLIAHGVPEEFIRIATDRLAAINSAWERLERIRFAR